jgi:hypothetical protein
LEEDLKKLGFRRKCHPAVTWIVVLRFRTEDELNYTWTPDLRD